MNQKYLSLLFLFQLFVVCCSSKSIEPTIRYYEKNGEEWYEKKIYCYPEGKYPATKGKRELAMIQQYRGNQLWESKVFYEYWPNWESKFVSKEGFYTFKDGKCLLYNDSIVIPDNIIVEAYDSTNTRVTYYYKNGERVLYTLGLPDGVKEYIYEGDKAGVYIWENGERFLLRKFTDDELKTGQTDFELTKEAQKKFYEDRKKDK